MSNEVRFEKLKYTTTGVYLLKGLPFTGTAYEQDREGKRVTEIKFVSGKQNGMAQGFYPDGTFRNKTPYLTGKKHGMELDWFKGGRLKQERIFEYGVLMTSKNWSADGVLVREYSRDRHGEVQKVDEKEPEGEAGALEE